MVAFLDPGVLDAARTWPVADPQSRNGWRSARFRSGRQSSTSPTPAALSETAIGCFCGSSLHTDASDPSQKASHPIWKWSVVGRIHLRPEKPSDASADMM